jgi:hypothetical protein
MATIQCVRFVEISTVRTQHNIMRLPGIVNDNRFCRLPRDLKRFGDDEGDELSSIGNHIRVQHGQVSITL